MSVSRMMARHEAFQEQAEQNAMLKSFVENKYDEYFYSCGYLLAGVVCLYAAIMHGPSFCVAPAAALQVGGLSMPERHLMGLDSAANPSPLNPSPLQLLSQLKVGAEGLGALGAEELKAAGIRTEQLSAEGLRGQELAENATDSNSTEAEGSVGKGIKVDSAFIGPSGWVVSWLYVEGCTAVGLPSISLVLMCCGLSKIKWINYSLFTAAVWHGLVLLVGCIWILPGHNIPEECKDGDLGDNLAYHVMWWICAIWAFSFLFFFLLITLVLCCCLGFAKYQASDPKDPSYQPINPQNQPKV